MGQGEHGDNFSPTKSICDEQFLDRETEYYGYPMLVLILYGKGFQYSVVPGSGCHKSPTTLSHSELLNTKFKLPFLF